MFDFLRDSSDIAIDLEEEQSNKQHDDLVDCLGVIDHQEACI